MKYLPLLLLLTACSATPKNRFSYSDGYTEDLFICNVYPTLLSVFIRSHDNVGAVEAARYYANANKFKYDNIECRIAE